MEGKPPYGGQPDPASVPPSQLIIDPVIELEFGDKRKEITSEISSGFINLFIGTADISFTKGFFWLKSL